MHSLAQRRALPLVLVLLVVLLAVPLAAASAPGAVAAGDKIIVNEIYRGTTLSATGDEWIEVVLTQCLTASELEGFYVGDSTSTTAAKFSGYRFTNMNSIAATFPAGTVIVVGGTGSVTQNVSYNPGAGDWNLLLTTSGAYVTGNGFNGDLAATDVAYVDTNGANGDATLSAAGFAVRWGSTVGAFGALANVAITAPANPGVRALVSDKNGATTAANWVVQTTTPGDPNGSVNTTWITGLRNAGCGDTPPIVASTAPTNGATNVALNTTITIDFSDDGPNGVDVAAGAFTVECPTGTPVTFNSAPTLPADNVTSVVLTPNSALPPSTTCTVTVVANLVTDNDGTADPMAANFVFSFTTVDPNVCNTAFTPIYSIQGSGLSAAITGPVTTQGLVVGDFELPAGADQIRGFYLQDLTGDADAATSDGIFVYNGGVDTVAVGQVVRVQGTAGEFAGQTQISGATVTPCGTTDNVTPVAVTLPFAGADYPERFEGMLVRLPQTLYVSEHFQLGRFGQTVLTSRPDRLPQPTNMVAPGAPALALQAANNLDRIILDDDNNLQNADPILFGRGGLPLSASNTLRGGDSAANITGVLVYDWAGNSASPSAYRVRPIGALARGPVNFQPANPRPAPPTVAGRLRVTAANLLNYFNSWSGCTLGVGGGATDCRGADSSTEFERQWPKTVANLVDGGADVIGIMEIENDGYGASSAIQDLVTKLNAATAPGTYAFINPDTTAGTNSLGTDAIKVGLIYKPAKVTPAGTTAALNSVAFVNSGDSAARNRPALAQAFQEVATGERFIVVVNHLKSKGSACDAPDAGDGQGNCSAVRTTAANLLTAWLAGNPTGAGDPDILIMGDLNSYAQEDPITAIKSAGYVNLIESRLGADAYSYAFDGQWGYLDHALASATLNGQVVGVEEWHINADEPVALDYNTEFKSPGQLISLFAPDRFRSSDHDPVIIGLNLSNPLAVTLAGFDAEPQSDRMLVAWETVSEYDNAGFNLYRADNAAGPQTLLAAVSSQAPGSTQGFAYSYEDFDVQPGQTYHYWLEDVSLSGATTLHGPVSATVQTPTAVALSNISASPAAAPIGLPWLLIVFGGSAALALGRRRR